ncbi:MAG: EcsC family protein [Clostridiales bacterium]
MNNYEMIAIKELNKWEKKVSKNPSLTDNLSKGIQTKINSIIPEKFHEIVTSTIKNLVKGVITGSDFVSGKPKINLSLRECEDKIQEKMKTYRNTAAVEGAVTGAGGIFLGLADFPILMSIKFKFLFDCANIHGFDTSDYKERLYILYVFQLTFSSQKKIKETYNIIKNWDNYVKTLPENIEEFDWRSFQQEYRDYLDLAKLFQLLPVVGAVVGGYVNYKLLKKLGDTVINSYRIRKLKTY